MARELGREISIPEAISMVEKAITTALGKVSA
jgi:lipoyl(octanoyl) transferase